MSWINLEKLRAKAAEMPSCFLEEVLSAGTLENDRLHIPRATYTSIKSKYQVGTDACPAAAVIPAVRSDPSPIRGAGDLVAKFAQPIARAIDRVAGTNLENCGGCKQRQAKLNAAIPFLDRNKPARPI